MGQRHTGYARCYDLIVGTDFWSTGALDGSDGEMKVLNLDDLRAQTGGDEMKEVNLDEVRTKLAAGETFKSVAPTPAFASLSPPEPPKFWCYSWC